MTDIPIKYRTLRPCVEFETTTNSSVHRKVHKKLVASHEGICSFCGWHRGENKRGYRKHGTEKKNTLQDHRAGHYPRTIQETAA